MTTSPQTTTAEDVNMQRLCNDLFNSTKPTPSMGDFAPLGNWQSLAIDMLAAHAKDGNKGARAFLVRLSRNDRETSILLKRFISGGNTQETDEELVGILLSDVIPEDVTWIWKGRLGLGKITMIDGDPGVGKSLITLDLAARVSRGLAMPDGTPCEKGGVVLITPEDGLADTIQPRLARAGANLRNIVAIGEVPVHDKETGDFLHNRPFTLPDDLLLLESAIERVKAKLIIIDPVMAVLGNQNTYKDNEVRTILTPVKMLAEKHGAACILVRHLNKGNSDNPLYRGGASIAFIGLARLGIMVAKDPTQEGKCVFAPIKANISKMAVNHTYSIASDEEHGDDRPYIVWEGVNTSTIQEIMSPPAKPGANRQEIISLLKEKGQPMSPHEIWQALAEDKPDLQHSNVKMTLTRMLEAGQVSSPARGQYTA